MHRPYFTLSCIGGLQALIFKHAAQISTLHQSLGSWPKVAASTTFQSDPCLVFYAPLFLTLLTRRWNKIRVYQTSKEADAKSMVEWLTMTFSAHLWTASMDSMQWWVILLPLLLVIIWTVSMNATCTMFTLFCTSEHCKHNSQFLGCFKAFSSNSFDKKF